VRPVASSDRTGAAAARFAVVLLFEGVALARFAAFGFDRRALVARAGFAVLGVVLGFLRRAPLDFFGETFRFARRGVRAALRFATAAFLRFFFSRFFFSRPFFFATRFVVFRFIPRLLLWRPSWPPRTAHPRASYAIRLRFPTRSFVPHARAHEVDAVPPALHPSFFNSISRPDGRQRSRSSRRSASS
jgi:hypothetical protein